MPDDQPIETTQQNGTDNQVPQQEQPTIPSQEPVEQVVPTMNMETNLENTTSTENTEIPQTEIPTEPTEQMPEQVGQPEQQQQTENQTPQEQVSQEPQIQPVNTQDEVSSIAPTPPHLTPKRDLFFKILVGVFVVVVLGTMGLIAYNITKNNKIVETKAEVVPPETTAMRFYNWYIDFKGNPLTTGAYKTNTTLTSEFISKVDKLLSEPDRLLLDPIVCGENRPLKVEMSQPQIQGNTATIDVTEEFETQQTMRISMILENDTWKINDVACPRTVQRELTPLIKIKLYFNNSNKEPSGTTDCGLVFAVDREVEIYKDPLTAAVELLLAGPTAEEKEQGYSSMFSESTKDILNGVKIVDKTAYVNLKDIRKLLTAANTSCGSKNFEAQIKETIKGYRDIDKVIFAIDGKTKDFYEWSQVGCNEFNNMCDDSEFSTTTSSTTQPTTTKSDSTENLTDN